MSWKDKDWLAILANYQIFIQNGDALKNLIESPIKQFIAFLYLSDYTLLRFGIPLNRVYVAIFGFIGFLFYIFYKYNLGKSKVTLAYQNKLKQFTRKNNDNQFDRLVHEVDDIHKYHKKRGDFEIKPGGKQ